LTKYSKIDLIATSIAATVLLGVSAASLIVVPTLITPVQADATLVTAPVMTPTVPVFAPEIAKKPKTKLWKMPLVGIASWYGSVLEGHHTASGERFHKDELTAAHRTLPFGTMVRVIDVNSGRSVVVRINDRGVLFPDRVIDLSSAAAQDLGILRAGVAKVRLEVLKKTAALESKADSEAASL
jgi:rare lipoprotein A